MGGGGGERNNKLFTFIFVSLLALKIPRALKRADMAEAVMTKITLCVSNNAVYRWRFDLRRKTRLNRNDKKALENVNKVELAAQEASSDVKITC